MRSFLVKNKQPLTKWGLLPDGIMYKGAIPSGYNLAIVPGPEYIIVDVDRHGDINGFATISMEILAELTNTFNYPTKNNGKHYWLKYSGTQKLGNKTSGKGQDLRTNVGYVVWYPETTIYDHIHEIKTTSPTLNLWLEEMFGYVNK
jgi:hypothetical protein